MVGFENEPAIRRWGMAYLGTASWFCCGSRWGSCPDASPGSCGTCQSGSYHAAWPRLYRPGLPFCDVSGCGMSLPVKQCGDYLIVVNRCNGNAVWVQVHDCGPRQYDYCHMPVACGSCTYCSALVDLTPRAFARLAPLHLGRIPVHVYA